MEWKKTDNVFSKAIDCFHDVIVLIKNDFLIPLVVFLDHRE